jgi:hypothetical protein
LQKGVGDVTGGDDTTACAAGARRVAPGAEGGTSYRGHARNVGVVVEIRPVQGDLVFEITARDDAALPGAVAFEVKEHTARRSGLGLDGLLPIRGPRDKWDDSFEIEKCVELTMPRCSHMCALGAFEIGLPRKIGHRYDGNKCINSCAVLRHRARASCGLATGIRQGKAGEVGHLSALRIVLLGGPLRWDGESREHIPMVEIPLEVGSTVGYDGAVGR